MKGEILPDQTWLAESYRITESGKTSDLTDLNQAPKPIADRFRALVANQGIERVGIFSYLKNYNNMPTLNWGILATFAAIAGAGGMTNTLFSNYAREKGWGMGANVGAIPSLIGGRHINLSHVGMVFPLNEPNASRWRGWLRHIRKDQLAIWMFCSVVGMALPCMLSLEFIRHAPVSGNRVGAMTADGMAARYPEYRMMLWYLTLLVGFLVLAPGQIMAGEQVARRWTDIIWTSSTHARRLGGDRVKYIYYGILSAYAVWGLFALWKLNPLQILTIAGVLMNVALGFTAWHTLYVNRTLLPPALRPGWFNQAGLVLCGVFVLGISVVVAYDWLH
jgi:hypothetical protein